MGRCSIRDGQPWAVGFVSDFPSETEFCADVVFA